MKPVSTWLWVGVSGLILLGVAGFLLGGILPGSFAVPESTLGVGKSQFSETKKKADQLSRQLLNDNQRQSFPGTNGLTHRVFVSRTLVYLPEDKQEPVQPLDRKLIMQDGIEVGWKLEHGFDPADPQVKDENPDHDGFTNLEEYEKGTDPNDINSSPSRWLKIKIASVETNQLGISMPGKSAGRYSLRFSYLGKKTNVDVGVGDQLWLAPSTKSLEVTNASEGTAKWKDICPHVIPVRVKDYQEKKGNDKWDEKTKIMVDYDDSFVEIERLDGINESYKILLDERGKGRGVSWSVGDIRLFSMVPGEGEMGPYRVGQTFAYAKKEFLVKEASPTKVTLWMTPEGEEVQILPKTP